MSPRFFSLLILISRGFREMILEVIYQGVTAVEDVQVLLIFRFFFYLKFSCSRICFRFFLIQFDSNFWAISLIPGDKRPYAEVEDDEEDELGPRKVS